ncbi:MAG TPA: bifunctional 5,10-methylenetetrahydrofolate dehydrogenase/5,10-methenyltetrahydrofolate cyclohydrolase [Thermoplasmata archaeon]|nr:bifunctional 5,10-methylenetetrahydrofolate dehydrogenase/5,10-methenyltetrahydrofolate cyclohydrolase [Thermoplasmata archaeon]
MTIRLEGKPVADRIDEETRAAHRSVPSGAPAPCLASVHRGVESPFRYYLKRQAKAAGALGISFRDEALRPGDGPKELVERLSALDRDPSVHAVLLEHPIPPPFDFYRAVAALRPEKDVDGVGTANLGRLVAQAPVHVPAVALAAVEIARHYHLPIEGERVVVLGRSETVGLPLALLLTGKGIGLNATVTVVHSKSRDIRGALAGARTIFSCVGRPAMLNREIVPEGAFVVDVGVSTVPDPSRPGASKTVGDADFGALDGWAAGVTPVPGGVGPVTVAKLMASTMEAYRLLVPGGEVR